MKRFIAFTVIAAMFFSVITGCKNESEKEESTTAVMTTEETTSESTTAEPITDEETTEELTTEKPIEYVKSGKIRIDDGKYQYTIEKKAFEDNYSEDFLMSLSNFYYIEFGCEDYDNWDGRPDEILNDLLLNGGLQLEYFEYNSSEWNKAKSEMDKNSYQRGHCEYRFTTVEKINAAIKERFGSDVRTFVSEDFNTYDEIVTSENTVFGNYDWNYRFAYLPESELIACFSNEVFCGSAAAVFVCDVKTVDGCYVVETVMGSENFFQDGYTFEGRQIDALRMFNRYTYGRLFKKVFTIAVDDSNNMYMLSVDKSYILPENIMPNYRVIQDNVNVEVQKNPSSEWEVVDVLSKDEVVYSGTIYWLYEDYVWISTEEYEGRVERKYLEAIK